MTARQCLFPLESTSPDLLTAALNIILCYTWEAWGSMAIKGWVIQIMREKKNKELTLGQWHLIVHHSVWTLQVTNCSQAFIGINIISSIILRTRQMVTRRLNKNRYVSTFITWWSWQLPNTYSSALEVLIVFYEFMRYELRKFHWWNNSDIMNT